jgi:hypothetical protein
MAMKPGYVTVSELITELQKYDPTRVVIIGGRSFSPLDPEGWDDDGAVVHYLPADWRGQVFWEEYEEAPPGSIPAVVLWQSTFGGS